jgi:hypothetical protein
MCILWILRMTALQEHTEKDDYGMQMAWAVGLAALAGILFPLSVELAGWQDGDGILASLISIQKLTWYFWGQDRLLNLLPALAWPLRDPDANLHFQLFLRSFMAYLAPLGILALFAPAKRHLLLVITVTGCLLTLNLNGYAAFNEYVQHNPFSPSLVMFALSVAAITHFRARWGLPLGVIAAFIAYATNFALILFVFPFLAICSLTALRPRRQLALLAAVQFLSVGLAYIHARHFGEGNTSLGFNVSLDVIRTGWSTFTTSVKIIPLACLLVLASLAALRLRSREALTAWIVCVGMVPAVCAMSCLTWIQMNSFDVRYYLIFVIVYLTCCSYLLVAACMHSFVSRKSVAVAIFLLGVAFIGLGGLAPHPSALVNNRWRQQSVDAADVAVRENAQLIVGTYWDVWPAVFDAKEELRQVGRPNDPLYGATFRGHVLRTNVMELMRERGSIVSVCFEDTVDKCIQITNQFITGAAPVHMVPSTLREVIAGKRKMLVYQVTAKSEPFVAEQVRATVSLGGALSVNAANNTLLVPVLVDNKGVVDFDSNANPPVTLGTQLASPNSKVVQIDFIRTNLGLIKAGSESVISVKLPIAKLVDHEALILPVQEGVAWFSDFGVVPLKVGPFKACGSDSAGGILCDSNGASIPVK